MKYELNTRARLAAVKDECVVVGFKITVSGGVQYLVAWWTEGARHEEWLYEIELEAL